MVEIPQYSRDESNDYLFILKSLNEIPFPVGKNLLLDFLIGNFTNKSIQKNSLHELNNFGKFVDMDREKLSLQIENLIGNKYIEESNSSFNKFMKILSITRKGQEELMNPKFNLKKVRGYSETKTEISDREIESFKELNDFLKGFNLEQKKAIISQKEKILCIAGAGTGKTSVLTKRIEFLNKLNKIRTDEILAITFTRKAKEEMEKRLNKKNITTNVHTFNSFCERILLKYGGKIYKRKVRVANYSEKMVGLLKALENISVTFEKAIQEYFTQNQIKNKNNYELQNIFMNDCYSILEYYRLTKKDIKKEFEKSFNKNNPSIKMVYEIVLELDKYLKTFGLRTYSDQLIDTIDFFKQNPKYIPKFKHILVDEFQDINFIQIELLKLLNPENLFCVGDPRQSIFGWRGSNLNYILNFKEDYPNSEIIQLKKNYRSNSKIVKFMNKFIQTMNFPDLEHSFENENSIKFYNFSSENEEFEFVLRKILSLEIPRKEIFVLARTNRQLVDFSNLLKRKNIAHVLKNENNENVLLKENEIVLSTIHSIKGLEAEVVFLIGCGNLNFPCRNSEHPITEMIKMYEYDREEEERRLFYVAISRAKNYLYMTYSGKRHTYFITKDMFEEIDFLKFDES